MKRFTVVLSYSWDERETYTVHVSAKTPEHALELGVERVGGDSKDFIVHAVFARHHDNLKP